MKNDTTSSCVTLFISGEPCRLLEPQTVFWGPHFVCVSLFYDLFHIVDIKIVGEFPLQNVQHHDC